MWRGATGFVFAGLVAMALRASADIQDRSLLLVTPGDFGKNVEKAERYLNEQAGLGYRLVSLRDLQVWERLASGPAREYRVVGEADADFRDQVNADARDGFRVHPDAWFLLGSGVWTAPKGAIVLERDAEQPRSCTYDLRRFEDLAEEPVRLPRSAVPLALPLDGLLVESCLEAGSGGEVTLRTLDTTRLFRSQSGALRELAEQLTAAASEGCRPVWVRVTTGSPVRPVVQAVIACDADVGALPMEFLVVPIEKDPLTDAPSNWAPAQAALSKAAADGFCLSSVVLGAADFLMTRRAGEGDRCEYRLVAGAASRPLDIVRLALDRQFFPVLRRAPGKVILLERRSPRG